MDYKKGFLFNGTEGDSTEKQQTKPNNVLFYSECRTQKHERKILTLVHRKETATHSLLYNKKPCLRSKWSFSI